MYDLWKPTFDKLLARIRNNVTSNFYEKFSYSSISLRGAKYKNLIYKLCIYTKMYYWVMYKSTTKIKRCDVKILQTKIL